MIKWCVQLDLHLLHRDETIWSNTRPEAFRPHFKRPPQRTQYLTQDFQRLQIISNILLENVRRYIYIYRLTTVDFIPAKRISSYKKLKNVKSIVIQPKGLVVTIN
jgi:hypothetical protein